MRSADCHRLAGGAVPRRVLRHGPQAAEDRHLRDLLAALDGAVAESDLKAALFSYVTSVTYLNAVRKGADRLDLAGQPAGAVTSDHEGFARFQFFHIHLKPLQDQRLKKQREQRAKKREAKRASKPDGLSALKAAWRARQGGAS